MGCARTPIKKVITRLLMHNNAPTLLYFYELLQHSKESYQLRCEMKKLKQEFTHPIRDTFSEDLKAYSDEGLQRFEKELLADMNGVDPCSPLYTELSSKYIDLIGELEARGLFEIPF